MLKVDKAISISGTSVITINGMENVIANMSANIDQNGGISQNSYINNGTVYRDHKEEIDADIEEFNRCVKSEVEAQE